jgi:3-dehydroquinate synthase
MEYSISFPGGTVKYMFQGSSAALKELYAPAHCVVITDTNVAALYASLLEPYKTITIPAGEENKNWKNIENITRELLLFEVHKKSLIIGIGGGMVTDIAGFIASVYMRGIPLGFVPTTLLGMVDAAIGGKNGINFGLNKNLIGTISQPSVILFDTGFLNTLPTTEWHNGFAEIIKYACLFDAEMFEELSRNNIDLYRQDKKALSALVLRCVNWKNKIVLADEKENNSRKLLNFGHTLAHALENLYHLPHGHAVSLGMLAACTISENTINTDPAIKTKLLHLLQQYKLPYQFSFDVKKVMELLKMDKKRNEHAIDYILLQEISKPMIKTLSFNIIEQSLESLADASTH